MMQENHSKVNFKKLVQDLADMYQDLTFDVVVTELVANALDSKASEISIFWSSDQCTLVIEDDGEGMDAQAFEQYHDFAAELKVRGGGIGFAGIGAKISFNIASEVITETRNGTSVHASRWYWNDEETLCWKPIQSNRLHGANGTRVKICFNSEKIPSGINTEYLISILKRHYLPLFIIEFARAYPEIGLYVTRPRFRVNNTLISQEDLATAASLNRHKNFTVKAGNSEVGWGAIGMSEQERAIDCQHYGMFLCTHGKVIKSELFGLSTGILGTKFFGIVEIPALIQFLTTTKSDLKGKPGRAKELHRLLDPVRQEMINFLEKYGITVAKPHQNQLSGKLERELTKMLKRLPELEDFDGLLRKSHALRKTDDGDTNASEVGVKNEIQQDQTSISNESDNDNQTNAKKLPKVEKGGQTKARPRRARRTQGPRVAFEEHPDRGETAWLRSDTIIINSEHVAYKNRITQDQARLTYCMFAIGLALEKAELVQHHDNSNYVDKFITTWGEA